MIIKPDWDIFKAKFSHNPQDAFEWFCYLLFCRKYELDEGVFGFKNHAGVEKNPIEFDGKVIGFQAKFYETLLTANKDAFISTIDKSNKPPSNITHLIFYTHRLWTADSKTGRSTAKEDIEKHAKNCNITICWKEGSFFESPFVVVDNKDLTQHFLTNDSYQGWEMFKDWSSKPSHDIDSEYFIDEGIKIISPYHKDQNTSNVVDGINSIRNQLHTPKTSVRLIGLSGVGKTRLAQALFDERIGENPLSMLEVWYCDSGTSPLPIPLHFINGLKQQNKRFIVIVDNCGQELHRFLTKAITDSDNLISLLTIEYDISDDLPDDTNVYKLEPNSPDIIKKVLQRHYSYIGNASISNISELTGGNYRLALAIASSIGKTDNISVLNDHVLFKRLFYQKGNFDKEEYRIAQVCSMVFSFNVNDSKENESEVNLLANFVGVTPDILKTTIGELKQKNIVQQRGDYRAILPHVLANHLAKKYIQLIEVDELHEMFEKMSSRMKLSFIKRLTYFNDNNEVQKFTLTILDDEAYYGKKIISQNLEFYEIRDVKLLCEIHPKKVANLLTTLNNHHPSFFSKNMLYARQWLDVLKTLATFDVSFENAFWLLLKVIKTHKSTQNAFINRNSATGISYLFKINTTRTTAKKTTKLKVLNRLYENEEYGFLLDIINDAINFRNTGMLSFNVMDEITITDNHPTLSKNDSDYYINELYQILYKVNLIEEYKNKVQKVFEGTFIEVIQSVKDVSLVNDYLLVLKKKGFHNFSKSRLEFLITNYENYLKKENPKLLKNLVSLLASLAPDIDDINFLIHEKFLKNSSSSAKIRELHRLGRFSFIDGFSHIDELASFLAKKIINEKKLSDLLSTFLSSPNIELQLLSNKFIEQGIDVQHLIEEIVGLEDNKVLDNEPSFLIPFFKNMELNSCKVSIQKISKNPIYSTQIVCLINEFIVDNPSEVSFYVQILLEENINYQYLGDINFKLYKNKISQSTFNQIIGQFDINNSNELTITLILLCKEVFYSGKLNPSFIKIVSENFINIINHEQLLGNFDKVALTECLIKNCEHEKIKVFQSIYERLNLLDYLFLNDYDLNKDLVEILLMNDTILFFEKFMQEEMLEKLTSAGVWRILGLEKLTDEGTWNLLEIDKGSILLSWINNDFRKVKLLLSNLPLYNVENNDNEWFLILDILSMDFDRKELLNIIIDEQIFNVTSTNGSFSEEMKSRLHISKSLKKYLNSNGYKSLNSHIESKEREWLNDIELEKKRESEENKEHKRFDY